MKWAVATICMSTVWNVLGSTASRNHAGVFGSKKVTTSARRPRTESLPARVDGSRSALCWRKEHRTRLTRQIFCPYI